MHQPDRGADRLDGGGEVGARHADTLRRADITWHCRECAVWTNAQTARPIRSSIEYVTPGDDRRS
ncbi:hypothetical protein CS0771_70480 [Catellatospora sp. IY07-71]|nr:hypothetical protein CS0771_70480 [Catellatospora sp. IY07-71]